MLRSKKITFSSVFEDFNRIVKKADRFVQQTTAEVEEAKAKISQLEQLKASKQREIEEVGAFKNKLSDFLGGADAS